MDLSYFIGDDGIPRHIYAYGITLAQITFPIRCFVSIDERSFVKDFVQINEEKSTPSTGGGSEDDWH